MEEIMIKFYAEIGSNFVVNGQKSFDRAIDLIDVASSIGCTGVKFQYFHADTLWDKYWLQMKVEVAKNELPFKWIKRLSKYARSLNLEFGLSIFDIESVNEVKKYVDYLKVSSFEIDWGLLLNTCFDSGKPVMLSAGLITVPELLTRLPEYSETPIHILHCNSNYPAQPEDCNLAVIDKFKKYRLVNTYGIGWSDHTANPGVIWMAIAQGAEIIEFHLDLGDKRGAESKVGHCWLAKNISYIIDQVRIGESAIGITDEQIIRSRQYQNRKLMTDPLTGRRG